MFITVADLSFTIFQPLFLCAEQTEDKSCLHFCPLEVYIVKLFKGSESEPSLSPQQHFGDKMVRDTVSLKDAYMKRLLVSACILTLIWGLTLLELIAYGTYFATVSSIHYYFQCVYM